MAGGFRSPAFWLGLSAPAGAPVEPGVHDIGWKGGGRIHRKGEWPEWWEDEEEPQPKKTPKKVKSTKERLAEAVSFLPMPKAKVVRLRPPRIVPPKPPVRRKAKVQPLLPPKKRRKKLSAKERARRRKIAAALLLLLDDL